MATTLQGKNALIVWYKVIAHLGRGGDEVQNRTVHKCHLAFNFMQSLIALNPFFLTFMNLGMDLQETYTFWVHLDEERMKRTMFQVCDRHLIRGHQKCLESEN